MESVENVIRHDGHMCSQLSFGTELPARTTHDAPSGRPVHVSALRHALRHLRATVQLDKARPLPYDLGLSARVNLYHWAFLG